MNSQVTTFATGLQAVSRLAEQHPRAVLDLMQYYYYHDASSHIFMKQVPLSMIQRVFEAPRGMVLQSMKTRFLYFFPPPLYHPLFKSAFPLAFYASEWGT
jgi:hypothetical protein